MNRPTCSIATALMIAAMVACAPPSGMADSPSRQAGPAALPAHGPQELATFAGGCFWCMEPPFERLEGVRSVISGFTGGPEEDPTYDQASRGLTGHTESVQISYDPAVISYDDLLEVYWMSFDPTDAGGQFADRGSQYRPGIFFHTEAQRLAAERSKRALSESGRFSEPIVVGITAFDRFYPAEEYHQDYYRKDPEHYTAYRRGSGRVRFLEKAWGRDIGSSH